MGKKAVTQFIIEDLARTGRVDAARRELKRAVATPPGGLTRDQLAPLALLAWRLQLPELGLRLLRRIIHPGRKYLSRPSDAEKVAYAACLIQMGAEHEGLALIDGVNARMQPLMYLVRVSAFVAKWEYRKAADLLRAYLALSGTTPYERLVAETNLAAALVFEERVEEASGLLTRLTKLTRRAGHQRLFARLLELAAIVAFLRKDWPGMREALEISRKAFEANRAPELLFVQKWETLAGLYEGGPTKEARGAIEQLRARARREQAWETLRECDHHWAIAANDDDLFWQVYFGTSFERYRERLLGEKSAPPPSSYHWNPFRGRRGDSQVALRTGVVTGGDSFKFGPTTLRLLSVLASDFYRPHRAAELHARIYPDARFDPDSSPLRVRKAIQRARMELAIANVPLAIEAEANHYRLKATAPITIVVESILHEASGDLLSLLSKKWPQDLFSVKDASMFLGRPERTIRRVLEHAVVQRKVKRTGAGRATRYRFNP